MNKEDRETLGGCIGLALGTIGALWCVSWLFHLGPDWDHGPWWALAYYITSLALGGGVAWAAIAVLLYWLVQQLPVNGGAPHG